MASVLCIGIAVLDHVFQVETMPTGAVKHRARDLATVGGGIAANAAVAVARQGGRSLLITRLGDDDTGRIILDGITAEGVDVGLSRRFEGRRSPLSCILVDAAGERLIVSYSDSAMPDDTNWLPAELPQGVDAVLGDTRWENGSRRALALARERGVPAVLDADRKPTDPDIIATATHAALSLQCCTEMTGEKDPSMGVAALRRQFDASSGPWLAVTDGANGVFWTDGGAVRHTPAFAIKAVDTLGAGDTWHGAFALGLAEGMGEAAAVRYASAVAAIKCTRFGGRSGIPDRAEVERFMMENP